MNKRLMITAMLVLGLAGCGSDNGSGAPATSAQVAVAPAPTTAPAAPSATGFFAGAYNAACPVERATLDIAIDAYLALHGDSEVTEAELVTEQLIREESVLYDVGPNATLIPAPGSGCPA